MAIKEKIRSIYREIKEAFEHFGDFTEYQVGFFPINQF